MRRLPLAALLLLLVAVPASAGAQQRGTLEPHLHGGAAVRGGRLVGLARREGDLEAGLAALNLGRLPRRAAIRGALRKMDLSQPDHDAAYRNLRAFRTAAFAGRGYGAWVREAVRSMRANADATYVQMSAGEVGRFVTTAKAEKVDLGGIGLLVGVRRQEHGEGPEIGALLAQHPEVVGIDVLGPESGPQDPAALDEAIETLLASGRARPVLRIHAGEGFLGHDGRDNVNVVLDTLVARSAKTDLAPVRIILAHAARVRDLDAANRALSTLASRGVRVEINVNPLSNVLYRAVGDVRDIAALRLHGAGFLPGSDNVGSLARNTRILDLLLAGRGARAAELARPVQRLEARWRR